MTTPTVAEVVERIRELVHAITQGRESLLREFTMRVPAEPKRDADLVLSAAAHLLEREHKARLEAERERDGMMTRWHMACDDYGQMKERAETAERELAVLRNRPCPYVHSSREGTHYCTLPHAAEKELAELRKRVAEAVKVRAIRQDDGLSVLYAPMLEHCQRVAILLLREGE